MANTAASRVSGVIHRSNSFTDCCFGVRPQADRLTPKAVHSTQNGLIASRPSQLSDRGAELEHSWASCDHGLVTSPMCKKALQFPPAFEAGILHNPL